MADTRRLPQPITTAWDWQRHGACRGMDSEVFFHPERERGQQRARRDARAKQICATGPVLRECREHALTVDERYGVWGGLSADERQQLLVRTTVENRTFREDATNS